MGKAKKLRITITRRRLIHLFRRWFRRYGTAICVGWACAILMSPGIGLGRFSSVAAPPEGAWVSVQMHALLIVPLILTLWAVRTSNSPDARFRRDFPGETRLSIAKKHYDNFQTMTVPPLMILIYLFEVSLHDLLLTD